MRSKTFKFLFFFLFLAGLAQAQEAAQAPVPVPEATPTNPYYALFFSEKVLTVSREGDGLVPGTLRTALAQASGIRAQNSFTLVKIVFEPAVRRVRVTKGPLPEIDGSLTTLDCQTPLGRGIIEGAIEDTEGLDPGEELAGLKITSTGNAVRNCHVTGFPGAGILLRGTRNVIEYNTIGYHKDVPETAIPASTAYEEPKTNRGAGVAIGPGANANTVQNNEIVANTFNGVEISQQAGGGNKVIYNFFAKNSGKAIKTPSSGPATRAPQITKITHQGDLYIFQVTAEPKSELQLYVAGAKDDEIVLNVANGVYSGSEAYTLSTKSKGFVPGQTRIFALSQSQDGNTSEFSAAQAIPGPPPASGVFVSAAPEPESAPPKGETSESKSAPAEESEVVEVDIPDGDAPPSTVTHSPSGEEVKKPSVSENLPPPAAPHNAPEVPDTTLNVKGMGDKGGQPDNGGNPKNNDVSSLGI